MEQKQLIKLHRIISDFIDIPPHKLVYIIVQPTMVEGFRKSFLMYGIAYTQEVHDEVIDRVGAVLAGSDDIEHEWTEEQYDIFVKFEEKVAQ